MDTAALPVAIQKGAAAEFGLDTGRVTASAKRLYEPRYMDDTSQTIIRTSLRAQYNETQRVFKDAGITEVVLARGVSGRRGTGEVSLKANPISSWSSSRKIAQRFAAEDGGTLLTARFPVSRVLSSAHTGLGSWGEDEFVVLSGRGDRADAVAVGGRGTYD